MRTAVVTVAIMTVVLSACGKPDAPDPVSPAAVSSSVLGDRVLEFSESDGNVYIKFKARDAGGSTLVRMGILDDARAVIRSLYTSGRFTHPDQVTVEAMFPVKKGNGAISDESVGLLVFERDDVVWENIHTLDEFENLLAVSHFPYNE